MCSYKDAKRMERKFPRSNIHVGVVAGVKFKIPLNSA